MAGSLNRLNLWTQRAGGVQAIGRALDAVVIGEGKVVCDALAILLRGEGHLSEDLAWDAILATDSWVARTIIRIMSTGGDPPPVSLQEAVLAAACLALDRTFGAAGDSFFASTAIMVRHGMSAGLDVLREVREVIESISAIEGSGPSLGRNYQMVNVILSEFIAAQESRAACRYMHDVPVGADDARDELTFGRGIAAPAWHLIVAELASLPSGLDAWEASLREHAKASYWTRERGFDVWWSAKHIAAAERSFRAAQERQRRGKT